MSVSSGKTAPRRQVSPVTAAIIVVLLIVFVAWRAWATFSGPKAGPLPPPPTQDINMIHQMAQKCQGDFNKLAPADQAKVQQITHGFGPASMASTYRQIAKNSP